jgi:hypothetical protein
MLISAFSLKSGAAQCSGKVGSIPLLKESIILEADWQTRIEVNSIEECKLKGTEILKQDSILVLKFIKNWGASAENRTANEIEMHYDDDANGISAVLSMSKK